MLHTSFQRTALTGITLLSIGLFQPAMAGPGDAARHFLDSLSVLGAKSVNHRALETEDQRVTIRDLAVTVGNSSGEIFKITVPALILDDIDEAADGSFTSTMVFDGTTISAPENVNVSFQTGNLASVFFPGPKAIQAFADTGTEELIFNEKFDRFSASNIVMSSPTLPDQLTIGSISLEQSDFLGNLPRTASGSMKRLVLPFSLAQDPDVKAQLDALGYEQLVLSFNYETIWDDKAGISDLESASITAENMATLNFNARFGGVTEDLLNKLRAVTEPADLMANVQGMTVNALSLSFDNQSIVDRALDLQAKNAGVERAQLVEQLSALLPLLLTVIDNPTFTAALSQAATEFLSDPKRLTITANPDNPVPVSQLIGAGMVAPQTLPDILGVTVEANR